MDDVKKLERLCDIVIFLSLLSIILSLFSLIQHLGGAASDIGGKLERTQVEQQRAADDIREIRTGIDECSGGVGRIGDGIKNAQESADRIGKANSAIRESIEESREIRSYGGTFADESERRITICEDILKKIREQK